MIVKHGQTNDESKLIIRQSAYGVSDPTRLQKKNEEKRMRN